MEHLLCPTCQITEKLAESNKEILEQNRGKEYDLECENGHVFRLHDGVMTTRLHPSHFNVFFNIQGIETGQISTCVGEWSLIPLRKEFDEIDNINTIWFPEENGQALPGVRSEPSFDNSNPKEFWILTSGDKEDWGKRIRIKWIVYGASIGSSLDIWRENLIFAARQLLSANYRPSVIQSAIAVESFVYDYVINYLESSGWRSNTISSYIDGVSRDSLPLQGIIKVCIQEVIGIHISDEVMNEWKRLKQMRDSLAHGDTNRYRNIKDINGMSFENERDKAIFAYRAAVKFIYEIRYH